MSIQATSYVLNHRFGSSTRKLIMIGIADFANDSGEAWPSIDTLAQRGECSRRTVQEHLKQLEKDGDLQIRPNAGRNGTHRYRIIFRKKEPIYTPRHPSNPDSAESAPPRTDEHVQNPAAQTAKGDADDVRQTAPEPSGTVIEPSGERETLISRINSVYHAFTLTALSGRETLSLEKNLGLIRSLTNADWDLLARYNRASLPKGAAYHRRFTRTLFIEEIEDIHTHAKRWERNNPPSHQPALRQATPLQTPEEKKQAERDIAEFLATTPFVKS